MTVRSASFLAGALWGLVAWGLVRQVYGEAIWGGLVVAPLLGVAVGALLQRRFEGAIGWARWLVALGSLYLGATMFALAVGITDALAGSAARRPLEVVAQSVVGTWWGVTLTGFLLALWPMAYGTHAALAWIDDVSPERSHS